MDKQLMFLAGFGFAVMQINLMFMTRMIGYDLDEVLTLLVLALVFGYVGFSWGFSMFVSKEEEKETCDRDGHLEVELL